MRRHSVRPNPILWRYYAWIYESQQTENQNADYGLIYAAGNKAVLDRICSIFSLQFRSGCTLCRPKTKGKLLIPPCCASCGRGYRLLLQHSTKSLCCCPSLVYQWSGAISVLKFVFVPCPLKNKTNYFRSTENNMSKGLFKFECFGSSFNNNCGSMRLWIGFIDILKSKYCW